MLVPNPKTTITDWDAHPQLVCNIVLIRYTNDVPDNAYRLNSCCCRYMCVRNEFQQARIQIDKFLNGIVGVDTSLVDNLAAHTMATHLSVFVQCTDTKPPSKSSITLPHA